MLFGLPAFVEAVIWFVSMLGMGMVVNFCAYRLTDFPSYTATGFATGCAFGPIGILSALSPATKGSRVAIGIGGLVGTFIYFSLFGIL